jgi:hypothetical protein
MVETAISIDDMACKTKKKSLKVIHSFCSAHGASRPILAPEDSIYTFFFSNNAEELHVISLTRKERYRTVYTLI